MTPSTVDILLFAAKRRMECFVFLTMGIIPPIPTFLTIPIVAYLPNAGHAMPLRVANQNFWLLFFLALSSIADHSTDWTSDSKYSRHATALQRADIPGLEDADPTGTTEYTGNCLVVGPEIVNHGHPLSDIIIGRKFTWKA